MAGQKKKKNFFKFSATNCFTPVVQISLLVAIDAPLFSSMLEMGGNESFCVSTCQGITEKTIMQIILLHRKWLSLFNKSKDQLGRFR